MEQLRAVILAAGEGKRMHSRLPKVLHRLCGRPMLEYVLASAAALTPDIIIVVGRGASLVRQTVGSKWCYVRQKKLLGTGHAVLQAVDHFPASGKVLVLCGDTPLLESGCLENLVEQSRGLAGVVVTAELPQPHGYGRIIRGDEGLVESIVEEKDASKQEKEINEVNTGTYCFDLALLKKFLPRLSRDNAQGEYYLTDIVALLKDEGYRVGAELVDDFRAGLGINNRIQLAEAEMILRARINRRLMSGGVTMLDPSSVYIDSDVKIGQDTIVGPNCVIEKGTTIGEECRIGPGVHLSEAVIGHHVVIQHAVIKACVVEDERQVGPYIFLDGASG
jgi:bifunctional UDP-N-acetylglucosamine pyrophosphorylase / glucosamine-1-phosphate N-acetyltransferase